MNQLILPDCPECHGVGSVPFFDDQPHRIERRPCGMCCERWNKANPLPKRSTVEDLQVEIDRLRDALTQVLQQIDQVCTSRSAGKMDVDAQTCLSMARVIAREALETKQ